MQIKIIILTLALPLMAIGLSKAAGHPDKGKKYPSCYKAGIKVDGNSAEWEDSLFNYNKQAQANYAIVNDTAALFVCVRIADEGTQMKILKSGIEIRFNSKGKKKAEATLHFPIGAARKSQEGWIPATAASGKPCT